MTSITPNKIQKHIPRSAGKSRLCPNCKALPRKMKLKSMKFNKETEELAESALGIDVYRSEPINKEEAIQKQADHQRFIYTVWITAKIKARIPYGAVNAAKHAKKNAVTLQFKLDFVKAKSTKLTNKVVDTIVNDDAAQKRASKYAQ